MNPAQVRALTQRLGRKYHLPFFEAQINQESGFNENAVSPVGARGAGQIMPGTARGWGVDPMDTPRALEAAARNMREYVDKYGSAEAALRAYNAGPGNIEKSKRFTETNNYVDKILGDGNIGMQSVASGAPDTTSSQSGAPNIFETIMGLGESQPSSPQHDQLQRGWQLLSQLQDQKSQPSPSPVAPMSGTPTPSGPKGSGLEELFYDPQGGWDPESGSNANIGPIGRHSDHVHVAANQRRIKWILKQAQSGRFGRLSVGEHPDFGGVAPGVHTKGSRHDTGEAGDVSGDPQAMGDFSSWLRRKYGLQ